MSIYISDKHPWHIRQPSKDREDTQDHAARDREQADREEHAHRRQASAQGGMREQARGRRTAAETWIDGDCFCGVKRRREEHAAGNHHLGNRL